MVTSRARQGNEDVDLYSERLNINHRPLEFVKEDKVVHKLRPVETFVLGEKGEPIYPDDMKGIKSIRSEQVWQLRPSRGGVAEMSANFGDLADAPDGDVVIDPSFDFQEGVSVNGGTYAGCEDSYLYINENIADKRIHYNMGGTNSFALWAIKPNPGNHSETRPIIRFNNIQNFLLGNVISAKLELTLSSRSGSTPAQYRVQPFAINDVSDNWIEGNGNFAVYPNENWVTWSCKQYKDNLTWSESGAGTADRFGSVGEAVDIKSIQTAGQKVSWNLNPSVVRHWGADSTNADWVNGIVLEVIDKMADYSNILQYYWHSSEASTTSNRPKLIVETAFTQYGADVGSGHNNSGYEIASRQNLLLSDGVNVVRFFDHPVDDPNRDYINNFFNKNSPYYSNSGIKAIIVFAAIDYKWRNQTASDYANRVNAVLSMPHVNTAVNEGRIIGIELGNEEAQSNTTYGSWEGIKVSFWAGGYTGGYNYAGYYLAAFDKIKNNPTYPNWKKLDVICSTTFDKSYAWGWSSQSTMGSSYEFARGFIDGVLNSAGGGYSKLPDVMQVHNYAEEPPEFREENIGTSNQMTEWFDRLGQMGNLCYSKGFVPAFAQTEYGYSPRPPESGTSYAFHQSNLTTLDEGETAQAVYYLRGRLITGTQLIHPMVGWKYDLYFHHPNDWNQTDKWDVGFRVETRGVSPSYGNDRRKVSEAAYLLHHPSTTNPIKLGATDTKIWLPVDRVKSTTSIPGRVWCGWQTGTGQKWGAIWRYKWNNSVIDDYYRQSEVQDDFVIPGDVKSQFQRVEVYKMNFSNSPVTLDGPKVTINSSSWIVSGGKTIITIKDTNNIGYVDEEPAFLKFIP